MKVLQPGDSIFYKVANEQPTFPDKGRTQRYVIHHRTDEGVLLFNTLTCELLLLDKGEYASLRTSEKGDASLFTFLTAHWFIVPEEFDERGFVQQLRPILRAVRSASTAINSYTILTTTDCNARCFYCYEKGRSRIPMSLETAGKVSSYIIANYRKQKGYKRDVHIEWFGGEPLYNLAVIDKICTDLKNADIPYDSEMISNAYLFSPEVVERAHQLWNLKKVQVTLDGTEEVYNRTKSYYRIADNAYQRVLDNIQLLLEAQIHVSIRMNLDMHNADNLMLLADELQVRFEGSKHLTCYSHLLFESNDHIYSADEMPEVMAKQQALQAKLRQAGMRETHSLPKEVSAAHCMADNPAAVVIAPTGQMGKCEHFTDSEFFAHIDHPVVKDHDVLHKFARRSEDTEFCNDCPIYPLCNRLRMCPEETECTAFDKELQIRNITESMIAYAKN